MSGRSHRQQWRRLSVIEPNDNELPAKPTQRTGETRSTRAMRLPTGLATRIIPKSNFCLSFSTLFEVKLSTISDVLAPPLQRLGHHISQCHRFNLDIGSCIEMVDPRFDYGDTVG